MVTGLSWPLRTSGLMVLIIQIQQLIEKIYMIKESIFEQDIKANKIKQGFLIKRSRILKEWKKRWMVLTKTHLYSFENKGVYRSPTQKIPLKQVSSIKSYYKNQYQRPQVFRIESDDTFFYLSANENQEKWAWMTSIQKMTELVRNPSALDSQNLVRQSLRMSNALRQSNLSQKIPVFTKSPEGNHESLMKRMKLKSNKRVFDLHYQLKDTQKYKLQISKLQSLCIKAQNYVKNQNQANQNHKDIKVIERIVQKIVQVKIPITVEKIVQKIVYIEPQKNRRSQNLNDNGSGLNELFAALINSKLDDLYPLLDFVAFLGLTGIEYFQNIVLKFCCQQDCQRFFAELILQAINQQTSQTRINRYTGFIYILCERQPDYFYASDLKILLQIILRELQLFRSDLNQMINLQVLKTLVTYHQNLLTHKKQDMKAIASQIANLGPSQNRQISTEICLLLN